MLTGGAWREGSGHWKTEDLPRFRGSSYGRLGTVPSPYLIVTPSIIPVPGDPAPLSGLYTH